MDGSAWAIIQAESLLQSMQLLRAASDGMTELLDKAGLTSHDGGDSFPGLLKVG